MNGDDQMKVSTVQAAYECVETHLLAYVVCPFDLWVRSWGLAFLPDSVAVVAVVWRHLPESEPGTVVSLSFDEWDHLLWLLIDIETSCWEMWVRVHYCKMYGGLKLRTDHLITFVCVHHRLVVAVRVPWSFGSWLAEEVKSVSVCMVTGRLINWLTCVLSHGWFQDGFSTVWTLYHIVLIRQLCSQQVWIVISWHDRVVRWDWWWNGWWGTRLKSAIALHIEWDLQLTLFNVLPIGYCTWMISSGCCSGWCS